MVTLIDGRLLRHWKFGRVLPGWLAVCSTCLVALTGGVMLVEMAYHHMLQSASGTAMALLGVAIDTAEPQGWLLASALLLLGGSGFAQFKKQFCSAWDQAHAEVDQPVGTLKT